MTDPSSQRAIAIAVLETELEAMMEGALPLTQRRLVEVRVCVDQLKSCADSEVETALAAIHEVRFDPAAESS